MVPSLDDFTTVESVGSFVKLIGDMPTLNLTNLASAGSGGKLATVQFTDEETDGKLVTVQFTEEEMNAPMRSLSNLPDVSDDFIVPDINTNDTSRMAAVPRQQSHPMSGVTPDGLSVTALIDTLSSSTSLSSSLGATSDRTTPRPMFDTISLETQFKTHGQEEQLENMLKQREIAELGRTASEQDLDLETEMIEGAEALRSPPSSAARVPKRKTRKLQRAAKRAANAAAPAANNSRRLATNWPDRILDLDTKALNRYLKSVDLTAAQISALKKERRRKKNRQYAMTSRHKRKLNGSESSSQEYEDALSEGVYFGELVVPSQAA